MASWPRFGDMVSGNTLDHLVVILFPYVLATFPLEAFQIERLRKRASSIRRVVTAFVVSFAVAIIAAFAFKVSTAYSRLETGYLVVLAIIGLILWRSAYSSIINRRFASIAAPVVVVLGDSACLTDDRLRDGTAEVIDVEKQRWTPKYDDPDFLDRLSSAIGDADRVILAFGDDVARDGWITLARVMGLDAEVWQPNLLTKQALGLNDLNGASTLVVSRGPLRFHERIAKRLFDLGLTVPGLVLVAPLMLLVAFLIKQESPGPVLFVQERVGIKNHSIKFYKFRTMRQGADSEGDGQTTKQNDGRITELDSFLRRSSLDELPQLFT